MNKNNFWNDAAKCGFIVGALLAVSSVLETYMTLSGSLALYGLMMVEWIAVVVAHYYLLHRFTRRHAALYTAEEGFTFSQSYYYVLVISAFAGIILGVVQYLNLHLIIGYTTYTEKIADSFTNLLAQSGSSMPASMEPMITQTMEQLQTAPAPSVLATVWGGLFTSLLFGAIFGLIIAGVTSRRPKPFDTSSNE
ncbi:MAG: DUF4199 domain-containing protein [Alistipes sp.]